MPRTGIVLCQTLTRAFRRHSVVVLPACPPNLNKRLSQIVKPVFHFGVQIPPGHTCFHRCTSDLQLLSILNCQSYFRNIVIPRTGNVNFETPGDSTNAFLHWGDVVAIIMLPCESWLLVNIYVCPIVWDVSTVCIGCHAYMQVFATRLKVIDSSECPIWDNRVMFMYPQGTSIIRSFRCT